MVPVRKAIAGQYVVTVARGGNKNVAPFGDIDVRDLQGQRVSYEDAAKQLTSWTPVFLLDRPWKDVSMDSFYHRVFHPDILFVYWDRIDERAVPDSDRANPDTLSQ